MNQWISVNDSQKPPNKSWVEALYVFPSGNKYVVDHFYWDKYGFRRWETHWRHISDGGFFSVPVTFASLTNHSKNG